MVDEEGELVSVASPVPGQSSRSCGGVSSPRVFRTSSADNLGLRLFLLFDGEPDFVSIGLGISFFLGKTIEARIELGDSLPDSLPDSLKFFGRSLTRFEASTGEDGG